MAAAHAARDTTRKVQIMKQISVYPLSGVGATQRAQARQPAASSIKLRLLAVALVIAAVVIALKLTGALEYLSFPGLARNREWLVVQVEELGLAGPVIFILIYTVCTVLSLPTGLLLSTVAGFLFGTGWGGLVNVLGATIGATIVFVAARTFLGDLLRARAGPFLQKLESGFRENELSYMLVLRFVPLFPFWLVNLAPAFLGVRLSTFVIGTVIGIIPAAFVFASVGMGLGAILDMGGVPDGSALLEKRILFPIVGLAVLAMIPVVMKRLRRSQIEGKLS